MSSILLNIDESTFPNGCMETEVYFSIIMPTYNQCTFIRRSIYSLIHQTYAKWELIIINDGSSDETDIYVADFLPDKRITYIKNAINQGLGYALNQGLEVAHYDYIAYLPSDDFYYENHLEVLANEFLNDENVFAAISGIRYSFTDSLFNQEEIETNTTRKDYCLQLVQVAHKQTSQRWTTRSEYVTEDLFQMFWEKIASMGSFALTCQVTAHWTSHPSQRHCILSETYGGGLNQYRSYYKVKGPIKMKVSQYKFIDEQEQYKPFSQKKLVQPIRLKILIVGELAYNPERIIALEEAGVKLYGLWIPRPHLTFSTVGPLPFGHVENVIYDNKWKTRVDEIGPNVIYGLLNAGSVSFVSQIVKQLPHIPYVWHFKEGPSMCLKMGTWPQLIDLYAHASGRIFLNSLTRQWYELFLPPSNTPTMLLDGDLPKKDYFSNDFSPKLSALDGQIHVVVTGRMIGLSPETVAELSYNNIHIHLYTANYYEANGCSNELLHQLAPDHFHVHNHISGFDWTQEFSKYDAGWLHGYQSCNNGNILYATWDDLNLPARISTYAAGGIPLILPLNEGQQVASNIIAQKLGIGIYYSTISHLIKQLKKPQIIKEATANMLKYRNFFSFDYHIPEFLSFCDEIIENKHK